MHILITGASRGIGEELAYQLADQRHRLILVSRNRDRIMRICDSCNEKAGEAIVHPLPYDLNELLKDTDGFKAKLSGITSKLDVIVNNAGKLIRKDFQEITSEQELEIFGVNYFGPSALIRLCIPFMQQSAQASIVNIATMGAVQGSSKFAGLSAYSASKGALITLTECLAEELKEMNIRVNALAIGAVQTEMFEAAFPGYTAGTSPREMAAFIKWFVLEGGRRFNGKVLQVSNSTP
ncbi:MAG: SDR family oxidoreductase [Bacteroidales bacterium]|nr:SDR family oxidoreductase [Bacteroidales bacterium]